MTAPPIARARRAPRPFDERLSREPRAVRVLKRVLLVVVTVHVCLALVSGYRAIVQIYRLDLRAPDGPLAPGSAVRASVVTSGRTRASVTIELVQDGHVEPLGARRIPGNRDGAYDPLPRRAALDVSVSAERLTRFHPGPARLRATALGSSQWLRVPPPTVREIPVEIAAPDAAPRATAR